MRVSDSSGTRSNCFQLPSVIGTIPFAPAREDFIGIMFPVMVMMVMMVLIVMMVMLVLIIFIFIIVVVMFMFVIIVMMVVFVLMFVLVIVVMMVMFVFIFVIIVVQIEFEQAQIASVTALKGVQHGICREFGPGRRDYRSVSVQFTQKGRGLGQLLVADFLRTGKDERRGAFHLVFEEFAEIAQVDLCLLHVDDSDPFGHG